MIDIRTTVHEQVIDAHSKIAQRAILRAGSDALSAAQAEAVRQVRARRAIRAKNVRDALSLRYPSPDPSAQSYSWYIRVSNQPLPVAAYPYSQVRAGISAQIKATGRALIRHAFEATVAAGKTGTHTGVFLRYGPYRLAQKGRYAGTGKRRQAIRELFTTRVLDVFQDPDFIDEVGKRAKAVFRQSFERNYFGSGRSGA